MLHLISHANNNCHINASVQVAHIYHDVDRRMLLNNLYRQPMICQNYHFYYQQNC